MSLNEWEKKQLRDKFSLLVNETIFYGFCIGSMIYLIMAAFNKEMDHTIGAWIVTALCILYLPYKLLSTVFELQRELGTLTLFERYKELYNEWRRGKNR